MRRGTPQAQGMQTQQNLDSLSGKLLIAMPGMGDPRFDRSVVYVCAHSDDGAMGLIVNKPATDLDAGDLLRQIGVEPSSDMRPITIHFGGPVEHGRGFVLHSADYAAPTSTLKVDDRIGMTATMDILEDIANGGGPKDALLLLGYSGWGPGQLESELQENGWLTADASHDLVFGTDAGGKWNAALASLGIDPLLLSASGGRA